MRRFLQFIGGSLLLVAAGCPSSVPALCDNGACEEGDGGTDGDVTDAGPDVVKPPDGCDPAADPKDAPKCVVSEFGVFVDATGGADANPGTKESPVKSITAALGKLTNKNRVYVCEGTYAEHVKLTNAVSIYGGFACGSWTHSGIKPKVAPTDAGYALHLDKISDATLIEDVTFVALGGSAGAASSVAAFVNASPNVTLRRVELTAGAGFAGKSPVKAADGALATSTPTAATLNGNAGGATNGGLAQLCTCVGAGTSKGGGGGSLNGDGNSGESVQAAEAPLGANGGGQTAAQCAIGGSGTRGSDAPDALAGAGAKRLGDVTETGWIAEPGKSGAAGGAGQGGGGGGGAGGGGGGGACGGCGGAAGESGGGGGASVALLALNSPVTLVACVLKTGDAGTGGAGGGGGDGIAGGIKGARGGAACDGGNGGKGGAGGAGGGGAGGVSVGVLFKGAKPAVDASVTTGAKGAAGNEGVDGQKADTLEVQ